MKSHVADYHTRVKCFRIVPQGVAPVIRLLAYPRSLTMSNGEVYEVEDGYEDSGYGTTTNFSVSSIDLQGILDQGAITKDALDSGVYDNARVYAFATSWANPIEDEEPMGCFMFGQVQTVDDEYTVKLMSLIDVVSQNVGRVYSPGCPWTLFDKTLDGRVIPPSQSRCTGPRAAPDGPQLEDYLVTGTLTSVTNQSVFFDTARTEPDDWFGYGNIQLTSGPNAGLKPMQIKSYAGGRIELLEAFFYLPQSGDTYEMIPGCRKDPATCRDKYSNKRNFGGQDHVPTASQYSQVGRGA